ncbi:efflux RND transporter periplasmic adaptor subunit [Paracoccus spongiarum]|uniref:Efflux RND transporter periplasmic adaptor subunit n=1 Tax=Paracoccus spongiarum TaxID=3064387 RepID=A0ABT9JC55_9RHOB|nr:efflux RND transporter periplasmic adaptor subunit [Paracoccus sp. 2205BS29-5]MDP5307408.1 efflux RND transporter periplasmic adaptor subunit [Paracoccus sp. 2205BS29-5]
MNDATDHTRKGELVRAIRAISGLIVILIAAAGGLHVTDRLMAASDAGAESRRGTEAAALPVETVPVEMLTFVEVLRAVGTARAARAVELMPDASGRIDTIAFRPGDRVAEGAVLLTLDDRIQQADLKASEATRAEAQAAFDRQEQLRRSGSASTAAYETARATLLRAEAEHDRARAALEDRQVRAPFAGVVGLSDLVEGQLIETSTRIATLDDLSALEIAFSLSETVLPRLRLGQRVELTSAAWPGRIFTGEISGIDTRVDPGTRSVALRARMPNADGALAGGMFLQVQLVLDERRQPAVPERALSVDGDRTLVMLADGGVAREAEIVTGQQQDGLIEVRSGLPPSARVIVSNLHRLSAGMAIEAVPQGQDDLAHDGAGGAGPDG